MGTDWNAESLVPQPEALRRLGGISRSTLWRLHRDGEISLIHIGRKVFLEPSEIRRFVAARRSRLRPLCDEASVTAEASVLTPGAEVAGHDEG